MPNDAKLGMIVGVGLVIAIAVVFFRKDGPTTVEAPTTSAVSSASPAAPSGSGGASRAVKARTAIPNELATSVAQRHTVAEGETLFSLAKRYYHDERKFVEIFNANQGVLTTPDPLTPGTVLVIPKLRD
jgi:nucleoid-associated protein YgaU